MPKRQPIEAWLEKPEPQPRTSSDTVIEMEPLPPKDSELDIFVIHRQAKATPCADNSDTVIPGSSRDMEIIGRVPSPSMSESSMTTLDLDFESGPSQDNGNPSVGTFNLDRNRTSQHEGFERDDENQARGLEEKKKKIFWTKIYLLMTLKVMFHLGMTPKHPERKSNQGWGKWLLTMAVRISILGMALLQSLAFLKRSFFWGMNHGTLNYVVIMCYAGLNSIKRVVFWGTLWWYTDDIIQLFQQLAQIFKEHTVSEKTQMTKVIFVLMIGASVGDAVISLIIPYFLYGEGMSFAEYQSYRFSNLLFVWETEYDADLLLDSYGTNVTATTMTMAILDTSIKVTGYLQENLINDVGLSISLTVLALTTVLKKMLTANRSDIMDAAQKDEHRTNIWLTYRQIRRACKLLDEVLGWFVIILHADNLLFIAYYLFDSIIGEEHALIVVEQTVFLVKLTCFYAVAAKAHKINSILQEWITTTYCITDVVYVQDGVNVLAQAVLHSLSKDPIGVGSDMFLMTAEFFAKFYGGVGSCFLLVYDFAKDPLMSAIT